MKAALAIAAVTLVMVSWEGRSLAIGGIHVYQRTIAPLTDRAGARCRFTPTCSHYAETVIARDGIVRGGWKTVKRIARCGPWTSPGMRDDP